MTTTITAYRTPPMKEHKAAKECRQAKIKAHVPTEPRSYRTASGKTITRRVPTVPGYVFAAGKPFESKHVRESIGSCDRAEVRRLYQRSPKQTAQAAYAIGEQIEIARGQATVPATVLRHIAGNTYEVGVTWMQKLCRVRMKLPTR